MTSIADEAVSRLYDDILQARAAQVADPHAAALATADHTNGKPSIRTVYVQIEPPQMVFFFNSRSGKGRQIEWNPQIALCFFWREIQQQAIVEGHVEPLGDELADVFWAKRPREMRLAAHASHQQDIKGDVGEYEKRLREEKRQFGFEPVSRPEYWRAVRVLPERFEFWDTGWHRARLRRLYERGPDGEWRRGVQEP